MKRQTRAGLSVNHLQSASEIDKSICRYAKKLQMYGFTRVLNTFLAVNDDSNFFVTYDYLYQPLWTFNFCLLSAGRIVCILPACGISE